LLLYHPQVIQGYGGKQHLGRIGVAQLPDEHTPCLAVLQNVGADRDVEVVLDIEEAGRNRRPYQAKH
jgi:hypothetical protein